MASTLNASLRQAKGKYQIDALRGEGKVPGNIYGKGQVNQNLFFERKDLESIILKGEADIEVSIEGKVVPAKIVEVQYFPTGTYPTHVDLLYR